MSSNKSGRHIADTWEELSDVIGPRPALIHGDQITTWSQFDDRASRFATALKRAGLGQGSTFAIDLYNCPEWIESFYAAIKIRAMPANVNYRYLDDELLHLLTDSRAEAIVVHASLAERVGQLRDRLPNMKLFVQVDDGQGLPLAEGFVAYEDLIASNEPAPRIERDPEDTYLSYTGGTTGLPKGVMISFARLVGSMATIGPMLNLTPEQAADPIATAQALADSGNGIVSLPSSPLMHSTAFTMTAVPTLIFGGAVVTLPSRSFDAHEACAAVEQHGVRLMAIVGDAIGRPLVRALEERAAEGRPYNMQALRMLCSAGVAWSADTKEGLFKHLRNAIFMDACGASEGSSYGFRLYRPGDVLSGTNFTPAPGLHVQGEDGVWVPARPGLYGILSNRTASTGYFNDPEKSARTFFMLNGEQYVVPGDYGRIEEDGTLTLVGRKSAVINTGGEKVHAEEVEDIIKSMSQIDDCLVFGTPDDRFGQRVTALVQVSANAVVTVPEISAFARTKLAGYKIPKDIFFIDKMPRGPNGKPEYIRAKEIALARQAEVDA